MNLQLPAKIHPYELMATIQIAQAMQRQGEEVILYVADPNDAALPALAGLKTELLHITHTGKRLQYDQAYREVASSDQWYSQLLNECSGSPAQALLPVQFPNVTPATESAILLFPFSNHHDFEIDISLWRLVTKFLRTYELPVKLICSAGQRVDLAGFTEADILSDCSAEEKLAYIANAALIVGVPNEWTEAAVYWDRKMIILYPEDVKTSRWFPYSSDERPFRLLLYPRNSLEHAAVMTGLRHLIERL